MRKLAFVVVALAFSGPAFAADMAVKMPLQAPPPEPVNSWTGCYVGAEGGGAWGQSKWTSASTTVPALVGAPVASHNLSGGVVGGTVGCNYQVNAVVLGLEGDLSSANMQQTTPPLPPFGGIVQSKQDWVGTLRARLGYTFAERWLVYGTGGLAETRAQLRVFDNATFDVAQAQTRWGWTLGAGIEFALDHHWTIKLEYLHMDFGTTKYFNPDVPIPGGVVVAETNKLTNDLVRAGVNYRF